MKVTEDQANRERQFSCRFIQYSPYLLCQKGRDFVLDSSLNLASVFSQPGLTQDDLLEIVEHERNWK